MSESAGKPFAPDEYNVDVEYVGCAGSAPLRDLQLEACSFTDCSFENAVLENVSFVDCRFTDTDLSLADVTQCIFNGVVFERCRLRGIDWTRINAGLLSWEFHECVLDYGNFEDMKLKKISFRKCSVIEATFDRADLRGAEFSGSKLTRSTFAGCDLRKADFRDTEDLALDLRTCRCDGLRLRLADAQTTLTSHGLKISR
jgi:fluoroquinolone resistance protein